jgi:hypothetical protein
LSCTLSETLIITIGDIIMHAEAFLKGYMNKEADESSDYWISDNPRTFASAEDTALAALANAGAWGAVGSGLGATLGKDDSETRGDAALRGALRGAGAGAGASLGGIAGAKLAGKDKSLGRILGAQIEDRKAQVEDRKAQVEALKKSIMSKARA